MRRLIFVITHAHWIVVYALVFVQKLVVANATVAWEVLTPGLNLRPAIVVVQTRCLTDLQIMLLANTITMTPGTLSLEVDPETRELYVHGLFVKSREAFVQDVHELERILLRAMT
jgi:multicomponent Na+:H+ antiporter subunit E